MDTVGQHYSTPDHMPWNHPSNFIENNIDDRAVPRYQSPNENDPFYLPPQGFGANIRNNDEPLTDTWDRNAPQVMRQINEWLQEHPRQLRGRLMLELRRAENTLDYQNIQVTAQDSIRDSVEHRVVQGTMTIDGIPLLWQGWLDVITASQVEDVWRTAILDAVKNSWVADEIDDCDADYMLRDLPRLQRRDEIEKCRTLWYRLKPLLEESAALKHHLRGLSGSDDLTFVTVQADYTGQTIVQPDQDYYNDYYTTPTTGGVRIANTDAIGIFESHPPQNHPYHWRLHHGNYYRMVYAPFAIDHNRMSFAHDTLYEQVFDCISAHGPNCFPLRPKENDTTDAAAPRNI